MSLVCRKIKIIQFITKIVEEPACVDPVDEGVVEEESDGDRCFDLFRYPAILKGQIFLRPVSSPAETRIGKTAARVGHHGFRIVEPGDAGYKEKPQNIAFFLFQVLRVKSGVLFDAALFEVLREGLVDVHIAVAVGVVRKRYDV